MPKLFWNCTKLQFITCSGTSGHFGARNPACFCLNQPYIVSLCKSTPQTHLSVTNVKLDFITSVLCGTYLQLGIFLWQWVGCFWHLSFLWWNYERVYVGIGLNPAYNDPWWILCLNPILSSPLPPWESSIKMEIYSNHNFWFKNIDETLYAMKNVIYSLYQICLFTLFLA